MRFTAAIRVLIIYSFVFCVIERQTDAQNVARYKPVYQSSTEGVSGPEFATDGRTYPWSRCTSTKPSGYHWLVIDLQRVYAVRRVRLWNPIPSNVKDLDVFEKHRFELYLGRKFYPCQPHYIDKFDVCAVGDNDLSRRTVNLDCFAMEAQFVAIAITYNPDDTPLRLCEVEVFGDLIPEEKPHRRPPLINRPITTTVRPILNTARERILRGLTSVRIMPYCTKIVVFGTNAEAVLTSPRSSESGVVMAASEVGQGRMITLSHDQMFYRITQKPHYRKLWFNMLAWLTDQPDWSRINLMYANLPMPRHFSSQSYHVMIWNGRWNLSPDKTKRLIRMLRQGRISVIFALRPWLRSEPIEDLSFSPLLETAGVWLLKSVVTWNLEVWPISLPEPTSPSPFAKGKKVPEVEPQVVPLERLLDRMTISFTDFIRGVRMMHNVMWKLPTQLQVQRRYDEKIKRILMHYDEDILWRIPCPWYPVRTRDDKRFVRVYNNLMMSQSLVESGFRAPGVDIFPGSVSNADDLLISAIISIVGNYSKEYHSTGLYLPPGGTVNLSVLENWDTASDWSVHIGCHTDVLFKQSEWRRYPSVSVDYQLKYGGGLQFIFSPFGGLLWVQNLRRRQRGIKLRISGVVEAPYFDLRSPSNVANWRKRRKAPGLWADIAGETIAFCVPSDEIRLTDTTTMKHLTGEIWDRVVKSNHRLRGSDWRYRRRERLCVDVQTSRGYGHSGYPMVGHLSWSQYSLNLTYIRTYGSWGVCHELGHNVQSRLWTPSTWREVTCNIFCLYNFEHVFGLPAFVGNPHVTSPSKLAGIRAFLQKGAPQSDLYYNSHLVLCFFAQLGHHLGWGAIAEVLRRFEQIPGYLRPRTDLAKRDNWLILLTQVTTYDLSPLFDFWGIEVSPIARERVRGYRAFLPDDIVTRMVTDRVNALLWKYYPVYRSMWPIDDRHLRGPYTLELPPDVREVSKESWVEV